MESNNTTCCLIFTKNPEPGKTKTRLIPALGMNGAYKIHIKLLKKTLNTASNTPEIDFQIYHTPPHINNYLFTLAKEYKLPTNIQNGIDLGERMYNAIHYSLKNYSHCIIIGTDCPELTEKYLLEAKQKLSSGYDAVIGPAFDGGYVLIGLNNSIKNIFVDIDWGTSTVLKSTLKKIENLKLKYITLPTLHDVDTKEDLQFIK